MVSGDVESEDYCTIAVLQTFGFESILMKRDRGYVRRVYDVCPAPVTTMMMIRHIVNMWIQVRLHVVGQVHMLTTHVSCCHYWVLTGRCRGPELAAVKPARIGSH
ncbi:hypothetical protein Vretimale_6403 [Volvox reticuliferus]|uniref:Uncharacterized protein n=1 Tax=Volvox reticuliferus TaxID=1737510 RepID=A0A8J4LM95_9CHLO|nr:hypothetical protein Vretimale_6403 [Volvox reticuliferus]